MPWAVARMILISSTVRSSLAITPARRVPPLRDQQGEQDGGNVGDDFERLHAAPKLVLRAFRQRRCAGSSGRWYSCGSMGSGKSPTSRRSTTSPPFVRPTSRQPALRKHRPGSRLRRVLVASTNVTNPRGGGSPHIARVAATASVTSSLASPHPSLRNSEHTHASSHHSVRTYFCHFVTHSAHGSPDCGASSTTLDPLPTNCGVPGFWRE